MKKRVYKWTRSFGIDPQIFGEWWQSLPDQSAETMVEAARNPKSPAHSLFDWDTKKAAQMYWLHQARVIVNSIEYEVIDKGGKPTRIKAFIASSDRGRYVSTFDASDAELTAAEQKCWSEMVKFRARWKNMQLARTVVDAIEHVDRSVRRRKKRA